jgi:hypothetical protein
MSEAPPDIDELDAIDAALREVVERDMALLRHVNDEALKTTDPDILNGYVRSQQRLARSVRQTLAARLRLRKERQAPKPRTSPEPAEPEWDIDAPAELPQAALEDAVRERVRQEYDPSEFEAIDFELGEIVEDCWEDEELARRLPADRLACVMAVIRETFGPSKAKPPQAETPPPPPEPEPGYLPPWDRRPPGARDRGGGSGW